MVAVAPAPPFVGLLVQTPACASAGYPAMLSGSSREGNWTVTRVHVTLNEWPLMLVQLRGRSGRKWSGFCWTGFKLRLGKQNLLRLLSSWAISNIFLIIIKLESVKTCPNKWGVRIYLYKLKERSSFSTNINIYYTYLLLRETSVHGSERKTEHLKTRMAGWFIPRSVVNPKSANNDSHILLQPYHVILRGNSQAKLKTSQLRVSGNGPSFIILFIRYNPVHMVQWWLTERCDALNNWHLAFSELNLSTTSVFVLAIVFNYCFPYVEKKIF